MQQVSWGAHDTGMRTSATSVASNVKMPSMVASIRTPAAGVLGVVKLRPEMTVKALPICTVGWKFRERQATAAGTAVEGVNVRVAREGVMLCEGLPDKGMPMPPQCESRMVMLTSP